ncbi:MAG: chaperone modulator CbpM [Bryobacteraceae bacterium]
MQQYAIILRRHEREQLTLDDLAVHANVHPQLVAQFVEIGLITPVAQNENELLFDPAAAPRLRTIVRLRRSLGINLAGISVVLDLLDKLTAVQLENEALRRRG